MENIIVYAMPAIFLLFVLGKFEWGKFFNSLGLPPRLAALRGANWWQRIPITLLQLACMLGVFIANTFKFAMKHAWTLGNQFSKKK